MNTGATLITVIGIVKLRAVLFPDLDPTTKLQSPTLTVVGVPVITPVAGLIGKFHPVLCT